jgi:hypothetical protein
MIRYQIVRKHGDKFQKLFGLSVSHFELILNEMNTLWNNEIVAGYKGIGRRTKLGLAEMILMALLYYRHYVTQEFIGMFFDLDDSNVCRTIRRIESLLEKVMTLPKREGLQPDELEALIIDATESQIERPKHEQKAYYSGKKKRHTIKTEIRITRRGRIVHVSESVPGSVHDFALLKSGDKIPKESRVYVDSGYQGIQEIHKESEYPYKKPKKGELTDEEKEYNTAFSRIRVKVENVIAKIKVFHIVSDRYRNKGKRFNEKFRIIAGIVNLKSGFGIA